MSKTLEDYAVSAMNALVIAGLNSGAWEDYDDLAKSAFMIAESMKKESAAVYFRKREKDIADMRYRDEKRLRAAHEIDVPKPIP